MEPDEYHSQECMDADMLPCRCGRGDRPQDELTFLRVSGVSYGGPYGWFRRQSTNRLALLNFREQPEVLDELMEVLKESLPDA